MTTDALNTPAPPTEGGSPRGPLGLLGRIVFWPLSYLYVPALVGVLYLGFALHMRKDGIFSCNGAQYGGDHYLSLCNGEAYGDYDHGAVWYGLEPKVVENAQKADVLFVGSSREQFGFSAPQLGHWFAANDLRYYLLGFSHFENSSFIGPLLKKIQPHARAYVINIDDFFGGPADLTGPGNDVMNVPATRARYEIKKNWQTVQQILCGKWAKLCGGNYAFWRQRDTGEWKVTGDYLYGAPSEAEQLPLDQAKIDKQIPVAKQFIAGLGVDPACVILTYVPPKQSDRATATALAAALGYKLVSPKLAGLNTFDGSHMEEASAERYVTAFLEEAGPTLRKCFGKTTEPSATTNLATPAPVAATPAPAAAQTPAPPPAQTPTPGAPQ